MGEEQRLRGSLEEHLNVWLRLVESVGTELPVTLLVSGTVVTGWLTPYLRWQNWVTEVVPRARLARSEVSLPARRMPPNRAKAG